MNKLLAGYVAGLSIFCVVNIANADLITPTSIAGTGTYNNSAGLGADAIIDNIIPPEASSWNDDSTSPWGGTDQGLTTWWLGTDPFFTIDYGALFMIEDIVVSVDNNDFYSIDYSVDNVSWTNLLNISNGYGEIGWGMDTMSTNSLDSEYVGALDFAPVTAQYLKIYATGGDNYYSVGELQAYGASVPEPATMLLFGTGLVGLVGSRLRRKKK